MVERVGSTDILFENVIELLLQKNEGTGEVQSTARHLKMRVKTQLRNACNLR